MGFSGLQPEAAAHAELSAVLKKPTETAPLSGVELIIFSPNNLSVLSTGIIFSNIIFTPNLIYLVLESQKM